MSKQDTPCFVIPRDTLLYQSTTQVLWRTRPPSNTAALSQHNTLNCKRTSKHRTPHTSTDPMHISRIKCFRALSRKKRRAAAVSKHKRGSVTKQTTGALHFIVAFALRGRGGELLREYSSHRCALGGRRSVLAKPSTPLANTPEHDATLLCQARDNPAVSKHDKGYCVKAMGRLLSQSTRHMLGQTNRHTAVIKALDTCCVKARNTLPCQTTRHNSVSKHEVGAVTQ